MYPHIKAPTGGGAVPTPDWEANLRSKGFKGEIPKDADNFYVEKNGAFVFTKENEPLDGKYNADGSKYDPTKSDNANPEVRTPSGTSGSGNGGRTGGTGSGSSSSTFGFGFSNNTSGDIGASFINAGYTIDAEKFMGASMGFGAMSSLAQMMPFGLGAVFANNTLGAALNNFMKSVSFNFDFSNMKTRAEQEAEAARDNEGATAGTETGSGSGSGQTVAELAKARGYTPTDTQGVYQNNGKFFKYDEKTKEFVECKADGSALGTAEAPATPSTPSTPSTPATPAKPETPATPSTPSTKAKTKTKPKTNPQQKPQAKSEAQLAKDQGFVRLDNGKYKQSKTGQVYEYKNGQFVYFADQTFKGGQFIRNKKIYNPNGTPSTTTIAFGNSPSMYTLTAYLNDKNEYTQSHYNGLTLLTTKDGTITRYFDSAGRLVQTNENVKAGFTRDPKNVVTRYTYGDRTGAVSKKETTNILTNTTVTTEYNLSGLKAGKTTKKGPVMTEQHMDGQGRTSTFRYQAITTVEVVNDRGKQKRITTVVKQQVR